MSLYVSSEQAEAANEGWACFTSNQSNDGIRSDADTVTGKGQALSLQVVWFLLSRNLGAVARGVHPAHLPQGTGIAEYPYSRK